MRMHFETTTRDGPPCSLDSFTPKNYRPDVHVRTVGEAFWGTARGFHKREHEPPRVLRVPPSSIRFGPTSPPPTKHLYIEVLRTLNSRPMYDE